MRILMVTSGDEACGVHSYTDILVRSLQESSKDLTIETCPSDYVPILDNYDLIHFQYQETLYPKNQIMKWLNLADAANCPTVITFHDQWIAPTFPFHLIHHAICHTRAIAGKVPLQSLEILPLGIPLSPFQVLSFGLGRTDEKLVRKTVESLSDALYDYHNGADPDSFIPYNMLVQKIRCHDVIVLWYPEHHGTGSSFAARLAIGCRRPLIVNDVSWFRSLPSSDQVYFASDPTDLIRILIRLKSASERFLGIETMNEVAKSHLRIYSKLLKGREVLK